MSTVPVHLSASIARLGDALNLTTKQVQQLSRAMQYVGLTPTQRRRLQLRGIVGITWCVSRGNPPSNIPRIDIAGFLFALLYRKNLYVSFDISMIVICRR